MKELVLQKTIEERIYIIRGKKVMLDRDLAELYGVEVKVMNQAVKRNNERFPEDFMFRLSPQEAERSRSQFVTLKRGTNIKYLPYAFTEQGIAMLSSVLNSKAAIQVNIQIMRVFTKLREILHTHKELQLKIEEILRTHGGRLDALDGKIKVIFELLDQLLEPPSPEEKKQYGFLAERDRKDRP